MWLSTLQNKSKRKIHHHCHKLFRIRLNCISQTPSKGCSIQDLFIPVVCILLPILSSFYIYVVTNSFGTLQFHRYYLKNLIFSYGCISLIFFLISNKGHRILICAVSSLSRSLFNTQASLPYFKVAFYCDVYSHFCLG